MAELSAGTALVESIVAGLPPRMELDERETALLNLAARQADDIASLERDIQERGVRVPGSRPDHQVLNPAIAEATSRWRERNPESSRRITPAAASPHA